MNFFFRCFFFLHPLDSRWKSCLSRPERSDQMPHCWRGWTCDTESPPELRPRLPTITMVMMTPALLSPYQMERSLALSLSSVCILNYSFSSLRKSGTAARETEREMGFRPKASLWVSALASEAPVIQWLSRSRKGLEKRCSWKASSLCHGLKAQCWY